MFVKDEHMYTYWCMHSILILIQAKFDRFSNRPYEWFSFEHWIWFVYQLRMHMLTTVQFQSNIMPTRPTFYCLIDHSNFPYSWYLDLADNDEDVECKYLVIYSLNKMIDRDHKRQTEVCTSNKFYLALSSPVKIFHLIIIHSNRFSIHSWIWTYL